jgi:hypothetical protein
VGAIRLDELGRRGRDTDERRWCDRDSQPAHRDHHCQRWRTTKSRWTAGGQVTVNSGVTHTLNNGAGTDLVINGTWLN